MTGTIGITLPQLPHPAHRASHTRPGPSGPAATEPQAHNVYYNVYYTSSEALQAKISSIVFICADKIKCWLAKSC